jgi:hypothetical protein
VSLPTLTRTVREVGLLLLALPVALVAFTVLVTLFAFSAGTVIVYLGVVAGFATLVLARWFGRVELARLQWAGRAIVPAPDRRRERAPGMLATGKRVFGGGRYWLALLHGGLVGFAVSVFSWTVTVVWLSVGLGGISYWFWDPFVPRPGRWHLAEVLADWLGPGLGSFDPQLGDDLIYLVAGVVCLLTLPFVTRGLVALHAVIANALLGHHPGSREAAI